MHPGHLERDFMILAAQDGTATSGVEAEVETSGTPNFSDG